MKCGRNIVKRVEVELSVRSTRTRPCTKGLTASTVLSELLSTSSLLSYSNQTRDFRKLEPTNVPIRLKHLPLYTRIDT